MDETAHPTRVPPRAYVFVSQWQFLALHIFEVIGEISSSAVFAWSDARLARLYLMGELQYLWDTDDNADRLPTLSPFAVEHALDPLERELETIRFEEFPLAPSRVSALTPSRTGRAANARQSSMAGRSTRSVRLAFGSIRWCASIAAT